MIMKITGRLIFVLLFLVPLLQAQEILGDPLNLPGARATGMGKAYTAIVNDVTSILWNPAAMGLDTAGQIGVIVRYTNSYFPSGASPQPPIDRWQITSGNAVDFGFFGLVFPFSGTADNTHLGLAVRKTRKFIPWQEEKIQSETDLLYHSRHADDGGVYIMTAALSVDIKKNFSLGAAFNFYSGEVRSTYKNLKDTDGSVADYQNDQKYSRTSYQLGIRYVYDRDWRFGLNLQLPFGLDCKQSIKIINADPTTRYSEILYPLSFNFGGAWEGLENFLFSVDYYYRPWQKIRIKSGKTKYSLTDLSLHAVHLGGEYRQKRKTITLAYRIGYYNNPTVFQEDDGEQISGHVLTTGIGVQRNQVHLNLGIEWGITPYPSGRMQDPLSPLPDQTLDRPFTRHDLQAMIELLFDLK